MAEVFIAQTSGMEGFERHVVVKRIRKEQAHDESFVKMFLDEARLATSLHHANVITVNEVGQEDGQYFLAMEYIHGEDLRRVLTHVAAKNEQVPFGHVITIMTAAASGLHYANRS